MRGPSRSRIACDPVDAADRTAARRALRARRETPPADAGAKAADDAAIFAAVDALLAGFAVRPREAGGAGVSQASAPILAAYWPMAGEPDVRPALTRWHEAGWRLALPQVNGRAAPLRFARWVPGRPLVAGPLGTREPADGPECLPDVLVIPCLGYDEAGYRLGYGGGYYDRTLAALALAGQRFVAIGVAREDAAIRGFEPGPHERPLDWILTPSRRIARRAPG